MGDPRSNKSALTDEIVTFIRKNYHEGLMSQKALAEKFSISPNAISRITTGKTWKHLPSFSKKRPLFNSKRNYGE